MWETRQEPTCLPERKTTPATDTGTERASAVAVARPIASIDMVPREGCLRPGCGKDGLINEPSVHMISLYFVSHRDSRVDLPSSKTP